MPLSSLKIPRPLHGVLLLTLLAGCASVPPPTSELAAAEAAIASAQALDPRGHAAEALTEATRRYEAAQRSAAEQRYDQARLSAEQALAAAELSQARARLAKVRTDVDSRAARNADTRRAQLNGEEL